MFSSFSSSISADCLHSILNFSYLFTFCIQLQLFVYISSFSSWQASHKISYLVSNVRHKKTTWNHTWTNIPNKVLDLGHICIFRNHIVQTLINSEKSEEKFCFFISNIVASILNILLIVLFLDSVSILVRILGLRKKGRRQRLLIWLHNIT